MVGPEDSAALNANSQSYWGFVASRVARDRIATFFLIIVVCIIASALLAPWIAPADPSVGSALQRLAPIGTPGHPFGTDELGRDMLSRLLHGGRTSLLLGVGPVLLALLIGGSLGILAGFAGGFANMAIMRTMDVFYAFPSVLLAIGLSGALGTGPRNLIVAVTVVLTPQIARVAESVTTQVRSFDFIEAARASGASMLMIMRYHVLRNVLGPILVFATSLISVSLIISAGLNFLGFGVQPPTPDWGLMLNTLRQSIWVNPVVAVLPGAMIFLTSFCFSQLSDGLRGALDVKE
jgi:peptide/nickel transport system permease protein